METKKFSSQVSVYCPGPGGPIFIFLLALFLFLRPHLLLGDGGTCRHFLSGLYLLKNGTLPNTTYMSAVTPDASWTTHELLCDLIFGLPFPWLGLNWVVLSAALAIALSFCWSYQIARMRGGTLITSLLALVLSIEACTIHWSARPHLFTYLLFLATYYETFIANRELPKRTIALSLIMLLWGNLHGSFPLGLLMIFFRACGDLWESKFSTAERARSRWTLRDSILAICIPSLTACLNLRGWGFISYVLGYLSSPKIHANSDEWRSLDFAFAMPVLSFLFLFVIMTLSWVYSKVKIKLGECLYMLFLFCASIYAMRLIPYFALAALPALSEQVGEIMQAAGTSRIAILNNLIKSDQTAGLKELAFARNKVLFPALAALVSTAYLFLPSSKLQDFDGTRMPVAAADYLKKNAISGLGYTKDNWGSYLYWRLQRPIFIDDATDFYPQSVLDDYTAIFMSSPDWEKSFSKYPFQYVLIPRGLPLESKLPKEWNRVYEDQVSVLFTKTK